MKAYNAFRTQVEKIKTEKDLKDAHIDVYKRQAVQDPVREEKSLRSRKKPRMAIRADAGWKCWIFPKSRGICKRSDTI